MNLSVRTAAKTHSSPAFAGGLSASRSGTPRCGSLTELRFSGDGFKSSGRPRIIPADLISEEPEPMHQVHKALNWIRHAGSFLSLLSTRRAKEKSSVRLLDQARVALGDGQLNTGLLRLQEAVDALPQGKDLFRGYENLGRFLTIIARDQHFLATAAEDERLVRQARAVNVFDRPNKDGTQPFRTPDYYRALEKTSLDIEAMARQAFAAAASLFALQAKPDSAEDQSRLGGFYERAGNVPQTLAAYEKAASLDSRHKIALQEARERLK